MKHDFSGIDGRIMLLILTVTSIVLQVISAQSNLSSLPSSQEISNPSNNTISEPRNASYEKSPMPVTPDLLNVSKTFSEVKQDCTLNLQNMKQENISEQVQKNPNSTTKNTSRRKRHKHNRIHLSKHPRNKPTEEKNDAALRKEEDILTEDKSFIPKSVNAERSKNELDDYQSLNSAKDDENDNDEDDDDYEYDDDESLNDDENLALTRRNQNETEKLVGSKINSTELNAETQTTNNASEGTLDSKDLKNNTFEISNEEFLEDKLEDSTQQQSNSREKKKSHTVKAHDKSKIEQFDEKKTEHKVKNGQKKEFKSKMVLHAKMNNSSNSSVKDSDISPCAGDSKHLEDAKVESGIRQTKKYISGRKNKPEMDAAGDGSDLSVRFDNKTANAEIKSEKIKSSYQNDVEVNKSRRERLLKNNTLSVCQQLNTASSDSKTKKEDSMKKYNQNLSVKNETNNDRESSKKQIGRRKRIKNISNQSEMTKKPSKCTQPCDAAGEPNNSNKPETTEKPKCSDPPCDANGKHIPIEHSSLKLANKSTESNSLKVAKKNFCGTRNEACKNKCTESATSVRSSETVTENVVCMTKNVHTTTTETVKNESTSVACNKHKLIEELKRRHKSEQTLKKNQEITEDGKNKNQSKATTCTAATPSEATKSTASQKISCDESKTPDATSDKPKEQKMPIATRINDTCSPDEKIKALKEKILPLMQEDLEKKNATSKCTKPPETTCVSETTKLAKTTKECTTMCKKTLPKKIANCTIVSSKKPPKRVECLTTNSSLKPKKFTDCVKLKIESESTTQTVSSSTENVTAMKLDVLRLRLENVKTTDEEKKKDSSDGDKNLKSEANQSFAQKTDFPFTEKSEMAECKTESSFRSAEKYDETEMDKNRTDSNIKQKLQSDEQGSLETTEPSTKGKVSSRRPFQIYLNMLNSLTKKSAKSEKKAKNFKVQEKLTEPTVIIEPHVALSSATNHDNTLEDSAKKLFQVYVSQSNRPTMNLTNLSSDVLQSQVFEPRENNINAVDFTETDAEKSEENFASSTEETNLLDLLFDTSSSKPKKSFAIFGHHLFRSNSKQKEKGKKNRKSGKATEHRFEEDADYTIEKVKEGSDDSEHLNSIKSAGKKSEIKALLGVLKTKKKTKSHSLPSPFATQNTDNKSDTRDSDYGSENYESEKQDLNEGNSETPSSGPEEELPVRSEILSEELEKTGSEPVKGRKSTKKSKVTSSKKKLSDRFRSLYVRKNNREGMKEESDESVSTTSEDRNSCLIGKLIPSFGFKSTHKNKTKSDATSILDGSGKSVSGKKKLFHRRSKMPKPNFGEIDNSTLKIDGPVYDDFIDPDESNQNKRQSELLKRKFVDDVLRSFQEQRRFKRDTSLGDSRLTHPRIPFETKYFKNEIQPDENNIFGFKNVNRARVSMGDDGGQSFEDGNHLVSTFDKNYFNNSTWLPIQIPFHSPNSPSINFQTFENSLTPDDFKILHGNDLKQNFDMIVKDISKNFSNLDLITNDTERDSANVIKNTFSLIQNSGNDTIPYDIAHALTCFNHSAAAMQENMVKSFSDLTTVPTFEQQDEKNVTLRFPEMYLLPNVSFTPTATADTENVLSSKRMKINSADTSKLDSKRPSSRLDTTESGKCVPRTSDHQYNNITLINIKQKNLFAINVPDLTVQQKFNCVEKASSNNKSEKIGLNLKNTVNPVEITQVATQIMHGKELDSGAFGSINTTKNVLNASQKPLEQDVKKYVIADGKDTRNWQQLTDVNARYYSQKNSLANRKKDVRNILVENNDLKMETPTFSPNYYSNNTFQGFDDIQRIRDSQVSELHNGYQCERGETGLNNNEKIKGNVGIYRTQLSGSNVAQKPFTDVATAESKIAPSWILIDQKMAEHPFNQKLTKKSGVLKQVPTNVIYYPDKNNEQGQIENSENNATYFHTDNPHSVHSSPLFQFNEHPTNIPRTSNDELFDYSVKPQLYHMKYKNSTQAREFTFPSGNKLRKIESRESPTSTSQNVNKMTSSLNPGSIKTASVSSLNTVQNVQHPVAETVDIKKNDSITLKNAIEQNAIVRNLLVTTEADTPKIGSIDRLTSTSSQAPVTSKSNYNPRKIYVFEVATKGNASEVRQKEMNLNGPIIAAVNNSSASLKMPFKNRIDQKQKLTTSTSSTTTPSTVSKSTSIATNSAETAKTVATTTAETLMTTPTERTTLKIENYDQKSKPSTTSTETTITTSTAHTSSQTATSFIQTSKNVQTSTDLPKIETTVQTSTACTTAIVQSPTPCNDNTTDTSCENNCLVKVLDHRNNVSTADTSSSIISATTQDTSKMYTSPLTSEKQESTASNVLTKTTEKADKSSVADLQNINFDQRVIEMQNDGVNKFTLSRHPIETKANQRNIGDFTVHFAPNTQQVLNLENSPGRKQETLRFKNDILAVNDQINDFSNTAEKFVPSRHLEESPDFQSHVTFSGAVSTSRLYQRKDENTLKNGFPSTVLNIVPTQSIMEVKRNHVIPRPVQFLSDNPKNYFPVLPVLSHIATRTNFISDLNLQTKLGPQSLDQSAAEKINFRNTLPAAEFSSQSASFLPHLNEVPKMVTKSATFFESDRKNSLHGVSPANSQRIISYHSPINNPFQHPLNSNYESEYKNLSLSAGENNGGFFKSNARDQKLNSKSTNFLDTVKQPLYDTMNRKLNTNVVFDKENFQRSEFPQNPRTNSYSNENMREFENHFHADSSRNRQTLNPGKNTNHFQSEHMAIDQNSRSYDEKNLHQAVKNMENHNLNNQYEIVKNFDEKKEDNLFSITPEYRKFDTSDKMRFFEQPVSGLSYKPDIDADRLRYHQENLPREVDRRRLLDESKNEKIYDENNNILMTKNGDQSGENVGFKQENQPRTLMEIGREGEKFDPTVNDKSFLKKTDYHHNRNDFRKFSDVESRFHERKTITDKMLKQNSHFGKKMVFHVDNKKNPLQSQSSDQKFLENLPDLYYGTKSAQYGRQLKHDRDEGFIRNKTLFNYDMTLQREGHNKAHNKAEYGHFNSFDKKQLSSDQSRYSAWEKEQVRPTILKHDEKIASSDHERPLTEFENDRHIKSNTEANQDIKFDRMPKEGYQSNKNDFPSKIMKTAEKSQTHEWPDDRRFAEKPDRHFDFDRRKCDRTFEQQAGIQKTVGQWDTQQLERQKDHTYDQKTDLKEEGLANEDSMNTDLEFNKTPSPTIAIPDVAIAENDLSFNLNFAASTEEPKPSTSDELLNGKLAIKLVDNVLSKVGKSKQLSNEFGLCRNNLTKIKEVILPPQGPAEAKRQADFVKEIVGVVNAYLSRQPQAACMILPPEMKMFLRWLIDDEPMRPPKSSLRSRKRTQNEDGSAYDNDRQFSRNVGKNDDYLSGSCLTSKTMSSTNQRKNHTKKLKNGDGVRSKMIFDSRYESYSYNEEKNHKQASEDISRRSS